MQTEQLVSRNIYTYTYMHIITMKKRVWIRKKGNVGNMGDFWGSKGQEKRHNYIYIQKVRDKNLRRKWEIYRDIVGSVGGKE